MVEFDPYSEAFLDDPYPFYERLLAESPVHYHEALDATFLARFEDIWAATQSRNLSVAGGITPSQLLLGVPANPLMPSQMDPPRHTAMRAVLSPHFRPGAAAGWEAEIRSLARESLDAAAPTGRLDVARDLGARISSHMACRLLGFPLEHAPSIPARMNAFFHRRPGHRGETEKAEQAAAELYAWVGDFVRDLRRAPDRATGLSADLISCEIEGRRLDDEALVHVVVNLLIAASDSFPKALSATVDRLEQEPDQRRAVAHDPRLVPGAFQEAVRIDTPTQFQGRTVLAPVEVGGRRFEPGERICFLFPAANRDPREFDRPARFDVRRSAPRTLAFGNGLHLCLGRQIAMVEARVALEELLALVPDYVVCRDEAHFARTEYVRGWPSLPIEFEPVSGEGAET
ncbi:MAG: cytochrome P450 [Myxococcota bacterium]